MTTWITDLLEKAKAATPGPWRYMSTDNGVGIFPEAKLPLPEPGADEVATAYSVEDAFHIAAADPPTVQRLCQLLLEAERLLGECLQDYGHPSFTDRHGMADRLRAWFAREHPEEPK